MVVIYILLAVIIVLIVVVAVMVKTSQGRRDDISGIIKAESSRLEGVLRDENKSSRLESGEVFSRFSREKKDDMERSSQRTGENFKDFKMSQEQAFKTFEATLKERFEAAAQGDKQQRELVEESFKKFDETLKERFNQMALYTREQNDRLVDKMKETNTTLDAHLKNIREDNEKQLDRIRTTVDEKLQTTLEKRLTESFKRVTDQLESVHKGLGEMQSLAVNVGDLKNVLTNVKIRGTWGEYQLGNILEQMLSPQQYVHNAHPNPSHSSLVVEYAVKLPGAGVDDAPVYLPIDSKFPKEDYEALVNASEVADVDAVNTARKNLLKSVKQFAKDIHDKYIEPPYTTNFAIMFVPVEGIYAEVLREPGFFEELQRTYKVTITGPTTLAAYLNSLQMGFRTLAITRRSDEIWKTLSAVKTEFANFTGALDQAYKQLTTAHTTLGKLRSTRVNKMNVRLRGLDVMEESDAQNLLGIDDTQEIEYIEETENV
jgi:DNA recombination protein RmuC